MNMMVQSVFFLLVTLLSLQTIHAVRISDDELPLAANLHRTGRGLIEILEYVKQAIESAQTTIQNITDSLSELIDDFQESITETISSIPIYRIINQLRSEIASTVGQGGGGILSEKCGKQADVQVSGLVARSSKASRACKEATEMVITELQSNIKNLANRARDMLEQFTMQIVNCVQNNKFNPINLVKCVQAEIDSFKQEMADIQQDVELSIEEAKNSVKESVFELASCINDVQLNTIKAAQVILADVETCMEGK